MSLLLAIESSCDETAAAVIKEGKILSNVVSSQLEHAKYGGVIPELASRLHMQDIVKVVKEALEQAQVDKSELEGVAFTRGPGLIGALLVGVCYAKGFALGLNIPLIEVNHMEAHVLANFLSDSPPEFPFLCLTVSGGHTQLVLVRDYLDMEILGQTIDDAAGEALDKAGKIMGLPYPAGHLIDKYSKDGAEDAFSFTRPDVPGHNFSFSGLKTSLLYFLRDQIKVNPKFIEENMSDICASYQKVVMSYLLDKMEKLALETGVKHLAIAGGVSANSYLRHHFQLMCERHRWVPHIPAFEYCTDNAGMIAIAGYFKFLEKEFSDQTVVPYARQHK